MSFDLDYPFSGSVPRTDTNSSQCPSILALTANHQFELETLLVALDRDSRCSRFGYAASDAAMVAHSQTALQAASRTLGVFVDDRLAGAAEIYRCGDTSTYEVSLVVDQPLRKRGLGWSLLNSSMVWARSADAERVRLVFSRHNWPMRRLAARASAKLDLSLDELNAEIGLRPQAH